MRPKIFIFASVFALVSFSVFSCGNSSGTESTIKITGMVHIYGNEPFTFVGIVNENGTEYAISPRSKEDELRKLQGHLIEFTVVLLEDTQVYGSLFLNGGTVTPISWEIIK